MRAQAWWSLLLLGVAGLPLLPWLWARQQDEPCALLLAPLLLTVPRSPVALDLRYCSLLLAMAAGFSPWLPLLARSILVALALGCLLSSWRCGRRAQPALLGLCLLSVPGMASGHFLLGYPLRRIVSQGSAGLLNLCGYPVSVEGIALRCLEQLVVVDAPCSGLKMAWVGLAVVMIVALRRNWSDRQTFCWLGIAAVATLLANCWRATALFLAAPHSPPAWAHELTGVCVFSVTVGALVFCSPPERPEILKPGNTRGTRAFLLAVALNLIPWHPPESPQAIEAVAWPSQFEGKALQELAQSPEEQRYYANFPGRMARFSDGRREIILRYITSPTRRLHPSADCFQGLGYQIKEEGLWRDARGQLWHRFHAQKQNQRLLVRERIYNSTRSWTDLSEWYWTAGQGPWWSICVAELE